MAYRQLGPGLQVLNTSHVGGRDCSRIRRGEVGELAIAQFSSQGGLQNGIGSGRSTAQIVFARRRLHIESQSAKLRFDAAAQSLTMLQGTWSVERDAPDWIPQFTFE